MSPLFEQVSSPLLLIVRAEERSVIKPMMTVDDSREINPLYLKGSLSRSLLKERVMTLHCSLQMSPAVINSDDDSSTYPMPPKITGAFSPETDKRHVYAHARPRMLLKGRLPLKGDSR